MVSTDTETLTVGRRIRWARREAGLSQDKLATMIGTNRQAIIRWEKDRHLPNASSRERIGKATGQHPDFFIDETRYAPSNEEDDEAMRRRARELTAPFLGNDDRRAAGRVPKPRVAQRND